MNWLELLKKIGFKEYEAKVYLALAKLGTATVSEIRKESDVPRNKIYESLESLEKTYKIATIPLFPKKYKIINEKSLKTEAENISQTINKLIESIKIPKQKETNEFFSILKGRKAVQQKLANSSNNVKKEILSTNKLSNLLYDNIKTLKKCIDRGVKVRFITTFQQNRINNYLAYLKTGMEIRIFDEKKFGYLLPRITIHDKKIARLTIGEPEILNGDDYITIWTKSEIFATALYSYLNDIWDKCEPIENYLKKK